MKSKNIILGGLLTALSILLPIFPGSYLRVVIPPFSATIASHVPVMLAMFINPAVAVTVAIGSAIGFLLTGMPIVIVARAAMHVFFASVGAIMVKKGYSIYPVIFTTMLIHGLTEALVVLPFGWTLDQAGVVVGVGTMLHHIVDSAITIAVYASLFKAGIFKTPLVTSKRRISTAHI